MLTTDVADGVHMVSHAHVNCFLVEVDAGLLLVDCGLPATWPVLMQAVRTLGRRPDQLVGLVLTHAHFDHLGCAARLHSELGLPVWVHPADSYVAAHPYRYKHERPRLPYPFRYPRGARILVDMAVAGALRVRGVEDVRPLGPGQAALPGEPVVVFTPGHTAGHCALHWPGRDVLLTGDAMVTLDPYTALEGPQVVARAATADSAEAMQSLEALAATGASVVLPGHGRPWLDGVAAAVKVARSRDPR